MNNQLTKVNQWFTNLKVYNSSEECLEEVKLIGKLLTSECKKYVNENYPNGSVLAVKSYFKETFNVDSISLYQLKQGGLL